MKKNNKAYEDVFDTLDDYYEEEGDSFFSSEIESDLSDVNYDDFTKVQVIDEDEDDEEPEVEEIKTVTTKTTTKKKKVNKVEEKLLANEGLMTFLDLFWKVFRIMGIILAVFIVLYYLVKGMFSSLFIYILLLILSFVFGFGFMALINKMMNPFHTKRLHPLRAASKKNKKGLASVILATNSPNSELVIPILIEKYLFVNQFL